jgi:glutamyl-tRNA synthetase
MNPEAIDEVRTRIAPSPTGFLHIGTARTALFNYLFAKQNNGKFILRIEDTDTERNKEEYEIDATDSLAWLGLAWDEGPFVEGQYGPYRQSAKLEIYKKHIDSLVKNGMAYEKDGAMFFKVPEILELDGTAIVFEDLIRGKVSFDLKSQEDFVILKSNGIPTYHFAVVIDDFDMKISHVIRGEEHLSNTPKHILLQKALNFPTPIYAHLPLIANPDHSKMSKRKDPVSVSHDFKERGYLPEAMINFIAFLGWAPKDDKEIYSISDLIAEFDLSRVGKSASVFNHQKLDWLNGYYIRQLSIGELAKQLEPFYAKHGIIEKGEYLLKVASLVQERLKNFEEAYELTSFMFGNEIDVPIELLTSKINNIEKTREALTKTQELLVKAEFDSDALEKDLRILAVEIGISNKELFQTIRVAVCGTDVSPPLFLTLAVIGKEKVLARIEKALASI